MAVIFLFGSLVAFVAALRRLRVYRWPRIQVRVLSTRKEVTGIDDGCEMGSLHAELEYWYGPNRYVVQWRCDLSDATYLPDALWMAVQAKRPAEPHLLPAWTPTAAWLGTGLFFLIAAIAGIHSL